MAVSKGFCRVQYCVEALTPTRGFSPKCRHMEAICLPQYRRETVPFPEQSRTGLEQDDGLWTRAGSCTGSKDTSSKAGLCRDILTSHHHTFHSCTHSCHAYLRILFRWAVSLGECYMLVPHLPWARISATHTPAMSFPCRSYSSHFCSLGLQQPGLCRPFIFILQIGNTVHHIKPGVSQEGQKRDLFCKTKGRVKSWGTTGFLFSLLAAKMTVA